MYKFTKEFYMRVGSGLGYKLPTIFSTDAEEAGINNIQPLSKNIKPEKSIGGNLDFNYKKRLGDESSLTFNQSFFINRNHKLEYLIHMISRSLPPPVVHSYTGNQNQVPPHGKIGINVWTRCA